MPVPAELRHFRAADWLHLVEGHPPAEWDGSAAAWREVQACRRWCEARNQWAAEHGWPAQLGDQLDRIREEVRVRRAVFLRSFPAAEGASADDRGERWPVPDAAGGPIAAAGAGRRAAVRRGAGRAGGSGRLRAGATAPGARRRAGRTAARRERFSRSNLARRRGRRPAWWAHDDHDLTIAEAAEITGWTPSYLAQLGRAGCGVKRAGAWHLDDADSSPSRPAADVPREQLDALAAATGTKVLTRLPLPPHDDTRESREGIYELTCELWDELVYVLAPHPVTGVPIKNEHFVRHRKGDLVHLSDREARRLLAADAVAVPGKREELVAEQLRQQIAWAQSEVEQMEARRRTLQEVAERSDDPEEL